MCMLLVNTLDACGNSTTNKGYLYGFVIQDLLPVTELWDVLGRVRSSSRGEGLCYSWKALFWQIHSAEKRSPKQRACWILKVDLIPRAMQMFPTTVHQHVLHIFSTQNAPLICVFHLSKILVLQCAMRRFVLLKDNVKKKWSNLLTCILKWRVGSLTLL